MVVSLYIIDNEKARMTRENRPRGIDMFTKKQLTAIKRIAAKGTKAESRTTHCTTLACGGDKLAAVNNYAVVLFSYDAFDGSDIDTLKSDPVYFYNEKIGEAMRVERLFANFDDYMANGDNEWYCDTLCEFLTPGDVDRLCKDATSVFGCAKPCIVREFGNEPRNNVTRFAVNAKYFRDACHAVGGNVFVNWSMNGIVVDGYQSKAIIMPVRL